MNNLNTKVDDSDVNELKAVPIGRKELSDLVDDGIVKNTKFSTLKTKITKLEQKILDATTLIRINQYNSDKQNLERKNGDVDQKIPNTSSLVTTIVLNAKISEAENKIPDNSSDNNSDNYFSYYKNWGSSDQNSWSC